ncbi:TorF family putative porin [uncultured Paraglaciecola sp.]|uniref:TorF family putative porin n=1 Tax=uncultured Paraglaciecola sp. TaxID=1765024 RepID=UPI00262AF4C8|nr:TorF family putative porin [uncultured Paraglaciecola sp.]
MKTLNRTLMSSAILLTYGVSQLALAEGSLSAKVGYVSEYHYRGIQQTGSGSANVGLDYENGGFSLGTWVADVADGLEVDLYGGYGFELDNGLSLGVGVTSYQYTGDFDSAYNEINLNAGFGMFSVSYNQGKWDGLVGDKAATEGDYSFTTVSLEKNGFTATVGIYGQDFAGEYLEVAYGTEVGGFDLGVGVIFSGSDLDDDEAMYFSLSKSFDL